MKIDRGAYTVEWTNGAHYAHIMVAGEEIDCFSFAWHKDRPTQLDFLNAFERWAMEE